MKKLFSLLKSKTVLSAITGSISYLLSQPHIGVKEVLAAVSVTGLVAGVRDAYDKANGGTTLAK